MAKKNNQSVRLPSHITPEHYKLLLKPDLEKFIFEGEETITLNLSKPTKEITLHSVELEILSAEIIFLDDSGYNQNDAWTGKIIYDEKAETATFIFPSNLPTGTHQLKLNFNGILNDRMRGFYRSKYSGSDGVEKYLATTQFESTDARRAFPGFDEPSHKAIFEISLMVPPNLTAVSNTIENTVREHESGYKIFDFQPTPKMSTYLLAFIVGELEFIEGKTKRGVRARVFTTPGKKHQAQFALDTTIKCIDFYEEYFDFEYPLPVIDSIAIPDFSAGAMENWGAVTYRETALLVDAEHTSTANKQWVALVIAHELAHMWFGDLVTMEWWTHLWLNEGFASYIEYLAVDKIFPDFDIWTQFVNNDLGAALSLDALDNTHPIEIEVHHPSQISEIFDAVSYSKGSSILRMLANFLGEKDFQEGLRHYLKKHQFSNASTENLWHSFEKVSKKPVGKLMKNWTSKPGYPIIFAELRGKRLELRQERFFASPKSKAASQDKTVWNIPISIIKGLNRSKVILEEGVNRPIGSRSEQTQANFQTPRDSIASLQNDKYLMTKKNLKIPAPKNYEWIKLNAGENGVFRTDYSPALLEMLKKPIEKKELGAVDRLGIVRDIFDLSESGCQPTDQALQMALSYKNEDDYTVWSTLSSELRTIRNLISDQPYAKNFDNLGREVFSQIASKMGWSKKPNEKHTDSMLRSLSLFNYGDYGDKETIKKAQTLFIELVAGKTKLEADLRGVVYNLVAQNGREKEYEQLLKMYRKEKLQEEQNRITVAFASFRDKALFKKTLNFALSSEVRPQDSFRIIHFVYANSQGKHLAWEFVKKNWTKIVKLYGGGGHLLPRFISPAARFTSLEDAKDIKEFFKKNAAPAAERTVKQVIEQIESNAAWLKRDGKKIEKFLSQS